MSPRPGYRAARAAAVVTALAALTYPAAAIVSDAVWHDRYHAVMSMAAYGDYNTLCPQQTFQQASMLKNFPTSTYPPWTVIETFGPTASGCEGYSAFVPEMGKVVLVFKGNYLLEKAIASNQGVTPLDSALGISCNGCTVNAFAMQGYNEAKAATNGWEKTISFWQTTAPQWTAMTNSTLFFSLTGHGLGGMHSLIASVEYGAKNWTFFTHSYGAPRTFNAAAAGYYDFLYGGDNTERAVANSDPFPDMIPTGGDYQFTNTAIHWYGVNATYEMNWSVCYEQPESANCMPYTPGVEDDHYFYFSNVGQCGGGGQNQSIAQAFIAQAQASGTSALTSATSTVTSDATSGSASTSTATAASGSGSTIVAPVTSSTTTSTITTSSNLAGSTPGAAGSNGESGTGVGSDANAQSADAASSSSSTTNAETVSASSGLTGLVLAVMVAWFVIQ